MPSVVGYRNPQLVNMLLADFVERQEWITWSPTIDQNGAVAATVTVARYTTLADAVMVAVELDVTGAGVAGNAIIVQGIPSAIAPTDISSRRAVGIASIFESGVAYHIGAVLPVGANDLRFVADGNANYIGITPNFGLSNGDSVTFTAVWEK